MSIESPVKFLTQSLVAIALVLSASGNAIAQVSGTALGLAATYDFKLNDRGRTTFYIGPKIELLNASNAFINVSQTKIGLIAGTDFEVSDDFTVGGNVTLNLSTSSNVVGLPTGSSLQLGIRFGDSTSVGIDAKFALSDNISLRPSIYFGNSIGVGNSSSSGGGASDRVSFNAALNENINNMIIQGRINSNNSGARSLGIIR